jgi:hypothetical protein
MNVIMTQRTVIGINPDPEKCGLTFKKAYNHAFDNPTQIITGT